MTKLSLKNVVQSLARVEPAYLALFAFVTWERRRPIMKVLRRIGITVLVILSLAVGLCFGQNTPEQIHTKGVGYAAEGKFEEAKKQFEKALKVDPFYGPAKMSLKIVEDANKQRIKSKTAIYNYSPMMRNQQRLCYRIRRNLQISCPLLSVL
jgi:tetratricopeptide (TPR) repeat protein